MRKRGSGLAVVWLTAVMVATTVVAPAITTERVAFAAPPAAPATSTLNQAANFSASNVNVWAGVPGGTVTWTLADATWDTRTGNTSDVGCCTANVPGVANPVFDFGGCAGDLLGCLGNPTRYFHVDAKTEKVGFDASVSSKGHIRFKGRAENLQADRFASVSYPGSASLTYPDPRSFVPGSTVQLGGNWTRGSGATINAGETSGDIQFIGDFGLGGHADLTAYLYFGSADVGGTIVPRFDTSDEITLFSMAPFDANPAIMDCCPSIPISGSLNYLSVTPSTVTVDANGVVTATGTNKFSDVTFDLDGILASITGKRIPALTDSVSLSPAIPMTVGYNLLDANAPIQLFADQTLKFQQDGLRIRLSFSPAVAAISGTFLTKDGGNWVEFRPGSNVNVQLPAGRLLPVTVTPTISLDNPRLTNDTKLRTTGHIELSSGAFNFHMDGFVVFPAIPGFDTGLDWPEEIEVEVGFECDLEIAGVCVFGHPTFRVDIVFHDIVVPGIPAVTTPAIDFSFGPIFPVTSYANSTTPNVLANNLQQSVNVGAITLNSFELDPKDPPMANAGGPYAVNEGSSVQLSAGGSSSPGGGALTYQWDFENDGSFNATGVTASYVGVEGPSTHPVRLRVCDTLNQCVDATTTVTVNNVTPSTEAGPDQTANEGSAVTLTGASFTDPGVQDTHTATINWGDTTSSVGTVTESSGSGTVTGSHVYADNGTYQVQVCVRDDDGAQTCDAFKVTVNNAAPTVNAGPDRTVDEGTPANLAPATFNDKGTSDTHTATIDWGDGTGIQNVPVAESPFGPPGSTAGLNGTVADSHVYADNGTYQVQVCVRDDDGASSCDSLQVAVNNAAPTVNAGPDQTVDEGSVLGLPPAMFNDKGSADTHTATLTWGDGAPTATGPVTESPFGPPGSTAGMNGSVAGRSHVYDDNGTYEAQVCVRDDDGAQTCDSLQTTVRNVDPTANAGSDHTEYWGLGVRFSGSGTDPSKADTTAGLQPMWAFGDGTPGAAGYDVTHVYADPGSYTATLTLTDKDGGDGTDTSGATIKKRETSIAYTGATSATFGFTSTLSAQLSDAVDAPTALLGGRTVTFTVGGYSLTTTTAPNGVAMVTVGAPAQLLLPGAHTIGVSFPGDSHYIASATQASLAVGSSAGGKVTGGVNDASGGRGGFDVQGGRSGIKGELEYQIGPTNFHAPTMDALGVSADGRHAWFHGIGADGRPFLAYVEDNGEPGARDVFRLWIAGALQNGSGAMSGGNIQIH